MKPLPAIAAATIAMALLLVPMVSVAAGTITFTSPNGASYKDSQAYTISGTVSPAPTQPDQVFIYVKNPSGSTVDSASATVTSGAFSYSTAVGGSAAWIAGTYTVTAQDTFGATGTTTFTYTTAPPFNLTKWILDIARNQTIIEHNQANILGNLSAIQATQTSQGTILTGLQSSLATLTGNVNTLTGNVNSIQTTVNGIQSSVGTLTSSVNALQGSISGLVTTVGNIQTTVNGLGSQVSNAATQATSAANAVGSTQTYVLVVAVLAAITLVLELAILVRKLS